MKQRVIVGCLIRKDDNFLFVTQNKKDGAYRGSLHIPGGGLNPGEDIEDGIRREVREETNIEIENLQRACFDSDNLDNYKGEPCQLVFLQFTADYKSGDPKAGDDAKELVWVNKNDLATSACNDASKKLFQRLKLI